MSVHRERMVLLSSATLAALLFLILALNYKKTALSDSDAWLQFYLYDSFGTLADAVFIVITYVGSFYVSLPVTVVLLCIFLVQKRTWTALLLVFTFLGARLLNRLLKSIFERPRPELEHLVHVSSESFPSGHAMNSIAFIGFLAYLAYLKLKGNRKLAMWTWGGAAVLIGLIGLSRIYLGVHYPTDVIGGFLAGGSWLLLSILLYTYIPKKEHFTA